MEIQKKQLVMTILLINDIKYATEKHETHATDKQPHVHFLVYFMSDVYFIVCNDT